MTGPRTWKEPLVAKRKVYAVEKRSSKPGWKVTQQGGKTVAKGKTKAAAVETRRRSLVRTRDHRS